MKKLFLSAILAGLMISIGGTVFISCESAIAGAVFFSVGLFSVCAYGMALFTGRVGYLIGSQPAYLRDLLIIWLGNATGCVLTGLAVRYSRMTVFPRAQLMVEAKLAQLPLQTVLLGVLCGILMYLAVDNFKNSPNLFGKYLGILLCVPAFILAGFEHCVADMFYVAAGGSLTQFSEIIRFLLLATLGNALGSFIIPLAKHRNHG